MPWNARGAGLHYSKAGSWTQAALFFSEISGFPAFDAILSQRQEGDHAAGWNTEGKWVLAGPYRPPRGSPGQNWGEGSFLWGFCSQS